jgi:Icc-related predicted phosphoesterase
VTTIFFATDIHGSDICWSKFLNAGKFYGADQLILGGDMTGKAVIPFIHQGGLNYRVTLLEQAFEITNEDEMTDMKKKVRSRGYFPGAGMLRVGASGALSAGAMRSAPRSG